MNIRHIAVLAAALAGTTAALAGSFDSPWAIIETADKGGFDLIVMGRRGQSHLRHTLLGSVSDRVADLSPCALLIIK